MPLLSIYAQINQVIYLRDNYEVDTGIALSCLERSACANMQRMEKTTTYRMR